jgi:lycopene cyclase domain-containing protein
MFTYLLMICAFAAATTLLLLRVVRRIEARAAWFTIAVVCATTLIFDNIMVGVGLVAYDPTKILGIRVPFAPVEDFGYAVVGSVLIPAIWAWLGKLGKSGKTPEDGNHD